MFLWLSRLKMLIFSNMKFNYTSGINDKKAPLYFILCYCSLQFCSPSVFLHFTRNTGLYTHIYSCSFPYNKFYLSNMIWSSPILSYVILPFCAIPYIRQGDGTKLEVRVDSNAWVHVCVCDAILGQNNYCAKPNPDPEYQYSYQVQKIIGNKAPWITMEYEFHQENAFNVKNWRYKDLKKTVIPNGI